MFHHLMVGVTGVVAGGALSLPSSLPPAMQRYVVCISSSLSRNASPLTLCEAGLVSDVRVVVVRQFLLLDKVEQKKGKGLLFS